MRTGIKQPETVEYFNYLGSMVKNDTRCAREIKSKIGKSRKLKLNIMRKLPKCYIWSVAFCGALGHLRM